MDKNEESVGNQGMALLVWLCCLLVFSLVGYRKRRRIDAGLNSIRIASKYLIVKGVSGRDGSMRQ